MKEGCKKKLGTFMMNDVKRINNYIVQYILDQNICILWPLHYQFYQQMKVNELRALFEKNGTIKSLSPNSTSNKNTNKNTHNDTDKTISTSKVHQIRQDAKIVKELKQKLVSKHQQTIQNSASPLTKDRQNKQSAQKVQQLNFDSIVKNILKESIMVSAQSIARMAIDQPYQQSNAFALLRNGQSSIMGQLQQSAYRQQSQQKRNQTYVNMLYRSIKRNDRIKRINRIIGSIFKEKDDMINESNIKQQGRLSETINVNPNSNSGQIKLSAKKRRNMFISINNSK